MKNAPWVLIAGGFHRAGGMDKANLALAEYLIDNDIQTHIVTHSLDPSLQTHPLIKLHRVKRPLGYMSLGNPALDARGRFIARKVTSAWPEAKVVVNGASACWPGINWAHYVHHAWQPSHDGDPIRTAARRILYRINRHKEKSAYRRARIVIANSNLTRAHLIEHMRLEPKLVKTVYLGSDGGWSPIAPSERMAARAALNLNPQRNIAVFVGGLGSDKRKGFDILIAAWRQLCSDPSWDVDLLIAGSGRALRLIQAEIAAWGLRERIRVLGFCGNIPQLLAASDLLVSPSRYEAYGLNVQEAVCRGLPAIVSASAGIAERYPEELHTFLLPDPENVPDLVQRLKTWRGNIDRWKNQFAPLARCLSRKTWHDMAREFVSVVTDSSADPSPNVRTH